MKRRLWIAPLITLVLCTQIFGQELTREGLVGLTLRSLSELSPADLRTAKMPYREGLVVVENESSNGPVLAGIQPGDVLIRADKVKLRSDASFDEWLLTKKAGETAVVTLYRRNNAGRFETEKLSMTLPQSRFRVPMSDSDADLLARTEASIAETRRKMAAIEADVPRIATAAAAGKAKWQVWESEQAALDEGQRPFELKGDRLGMTLEMFKGRHFRTIKGDPRPAPFSSDADPKEDNVSLLYEAKLAKAGIVHARTTFPFEEYGTEANKPTLAGVTAETMLYHFIDGKLYQITVAVVHDDYQKLLEALAAKYGEPKSTTERAYQNRFGATFKGDIVEWQNPTSSILMLERASNLERSMVVFHHTELFKLATERTKAVIKPNTDDL